MLAASVKNEENEASVGDEADVGDEAGVVAAEVESDESNPMAMLRSR